LGFVVGYFFIDQLGQLSFFISRTTVTGLLLCWYFMIVKLATKADMETTVDVELEQPT
jgi:hypothetical protein